MRIRPKDVAPSTPQRLAVIGGGVMGRGIALVGAAAGMDVSVLDVSPEAAERAVAEIRRIAEREESRGRLRGTSADVIGAHQADFELCRSREFRYRD